MSQIPPQRSFLRRLSKLDRSAIVFLLAYLLTRLLIGHPFSVIGRLGNRQPDGCGLPGLPCVFMDAQQSALGAPQPFNRRLYLYRAGSCGASPEHDGNRPLSAFIRKSARTCCKDDLQDRIGVISADSEEITIAVTQEIQPGQSPIDQALLTRPTVASLIGAARNSNGLACVFSCIAPRLIDPAKGQRFYPGLTVYRGQLMFAAEQQRETPAGPVSVLVGAPITPSLLDGLTSDLGPIQFTLLQPAGADSKGLRFAVGGKTYVTGERIVSSNRALPPPANWLDIPVGGAAVLQSLFG